MDNPEIVRVEAFDEELRLILNLTNRMLTNLASIFNNLLLLEDIIVFTDEEKEEIKESTTYLKFIIQELIDFLKVSDHRYYIFSTYQRRTLRTRLSRFRRQIMHIETSNEILDRDGILSIFEDLVEEGYEFHTWIVSYRQFINTQILNDKKIENLNREIANSQALLHQINSQRTELIYSKASEKYFNSAKIYENLFYMIFGAAILVTIVSLIHFPHRTSDIVDYVLYKVLTFSVVLTIGTIFLRRASHLRKLHDQAHQTSMELQALPLYLRNVDESEHSGIYKNLADKYFGKELDQTQNDKIGDLMKDQLASGTELIKVSAELVKAKGGSTTPP